MKLKFYSKNRNCIPSRAHKTDAGLDLKADNDYLLLPREITKVYTGVHVEIPPGYTGLIFARSGMSVKTGLQLANSVGVIDSDYRGELICAFTNRSDDLKEIKKGSRIAQLVIVPIALPELERIKSLDEFSETARGDGGFGHTGE